MFGRLGEKLIERADRVVTEDLPKVRPFWIWGITPRQAVIRAVWEGAWFIWQDIPGEVISTVFGAVEKKAPEALKEGFKSTLAKAWETAFWKTISKALKPALLAVQKGAAAYWKLKQNQPELARDLESIVNIGLFAAELPGIKQFGRWAKQLIGKWATKVASKTDDLVSEAKKYKTADEFVKGNHIVGKHTYTPNFTKRHMSPKEYERYIKETSNHWLINLDPEAVDFYQHILAAWEGKPQLTQKVIDSFSITVPTKPVRLYRWINKHQYKWGGNMFESWTYDKKKAEKYGGWGVISETINPSDIVIDTTYASKDPTWSEKLRRIWKETWIQWWYTDKEVIVFSEKFRETNTQLRKIREQANKWLPKKTTNLIEEAKKYKTADEFVESRGKPIYHWWKWDIQEFMIPKEWKEKAVFFTSKKNVAWSYIDTAKSPWKLKVEFLEDLYFDKKITKEEFIKKREAIKWQMWDEKWRITEAFLNNNAKTKKITGVERYNASTQEKIIDEARREWYDVVVIKNTIDDAFEYWEWIPSDITIVFNSEKIKTESQLRKIREQANPQPLSKKWEKVIDIVMAPENAKTKRTAFGEGRLGIEDEWVKTELFGKRKWKIAPSQKEIDVANTIPEVIKKPSKNPEKLMGQIKDEIGVRSTKLEWRMKDVSVGEFQNDLNKTILELEGSLIKDPNVAATLSINEKTAIKQLIIDLRAAENADEVWKARQTFDNAVKQKIKEGINLTDIQETRRDNWLKHRRELNEVMDKAVDLAGDASVSSEFRILSHLYEARNNMIMRAPEFAKAKSGIFSLKNLTTAWLTAGGSIAWAAVLDQLLD